MPAWLRAVGAITPVGDDAPMTTASVVAGIQHFDDLDVHGPGGIPVTGGRVPLEGDLTGPQRLSALGLLALRECAAGAQPRARVPLVVCLPEIGDLACPPELVVGGLSADDPSLPIDPTNVLVLTQGRIGLFTGLDAATQAFARGHTDCLLVAVDSLTSTARIARLRRRGRLLQQGDGDGSIPSEGAVALWLTAARTARSLAFIGGHAVAPEPRVLGSADPVTGAGLTAAARAAMAATRSSPALPGSVFHDGSGPQAWFEELTLTLARPPLAERPPERIITPAVSTGEIGTASSALSVALAGVLLSRNEVPGPALVTASGDGPTRAATVILPATTMDGERAHG